MALSSFRQKWEDRRETFLRVNAYVDGAKLIDELLEDLRQNNRQP